MSTWKPRTYEARARGGVTVAPRRLAWTNARQSYPCAGGAVSGQPGVFRANPDPARAVEAGIDKWRTGCVLIDAREVSVSVSSSVECSRSVGQASMQHADRLLLRSTTALAATDVGENRYLGVDVTRTRGLVNAGYRSDGLVLEVSAPDPVPDLRGLPGLRYWIKTFHPGRPNQLQVIAPGTVRAGDTICRLPP